MGWADLMGHPFHVSSFSLIESANIPMEYISIPIEGRPVEGTPLEAARGRVRQSIPHQRLTKVDVKLKLTLPTPKTAFHSLSMLLYKSENRSRMTSTFMPSFRE